MLHTYTEYVDSSNQIPQTEIQEYINALIKIEDE